jgi:subtilisin family serine protease
MRKKIFALIAVTIILFTSTISVSTAEPEPELPERMEIHYTISPTKEEAFTQFDDWVDSPSDIVPFNLDMIDVENLYDYDDDDDECIYVAVLDTGLLSNYLDFFPEEMVDIKEEWGIGFTHDVWYVGSGGNWTSDLFAYGKLRNDRGFLTYDYGNPLWVYYPPHETWYPHPLGSGHGTHVTSTITGWQLEMDGFSIWVRGVAPKVTIIPVLVLDDWVVYNETGSGWWWSGGTEEMVAAGIRYVADLARTHKIKIVINMSLGGDDPSEIELEAIDYAIKEGCIVIASAGNSGYGGMTWPAAYPQVISVAAAGWTQEYLQYATGHPDPWWWWTEDVPEDLWTEDPQGNEFQLYLTDYSSRPNSTKDQKDNYLDVSAPGAAIKGPYKPYGNVDWDYYSMWGTSMAAPHVSGISSLVLEKVSNIKQRGMEGILKGAAHVNSLTHKGEKERSATVYNIFTYEYSEVTWLRRDYGSGFIQADEALHYNSK